MIVPLLAFPRLIGAFVMMVRSPPSEMSVRSMTVSFVGFVCQIA